MVEYENKLNQLEQDKEQLCNKMVQKKLCLSSNLTEKNNTLEEKIFLFTE